jgi:hypothetical protein
VAAAADDIAPSTNRVKSRNKGDRTKEERRVGHCAKSGIGAESADWPASMALFVAFAGFPSCRAAEKCAPEPGVPAFRGRTGSERLKLAS